MTSLLIRLFVKDAENTRDARVRKPYGVLSGAVGIACNLFLFALKMAIGLLSSAISIAAADAFNNLSDGLSCLISIVGFKVSGKGRTQSIRSVMGARNISRGLIVSFVIVWSALGFLKTSAGRILHQSRSRHRPSDRHSRGFHGSQAVDGCVQRRDRPPDRFARADGRGAGQPEQCHRPAWSWSA